MDSETDKRITELEIRLAYLEEALSVLNDTVCAQGAALEAVHERLERTDTRLKALLSGSAGEDVP